MISYKQWKLLNESLGTYSLGLKNPQNLGLVSNHHTGDVESGDATMDEMGMPMMKSPKYFSDMGGMGKKKPFPPSPMGDEDMGDEDMGDEGDEDMDMDGEDMGDEDSDIDPDAHFGDDDDMDMDDDEEGDEDMDMMPKKKPFGNPHSAGPFMRFSKKMKEGCGCDDDKKSKSDDESDGDDELVGGKGDKGKELAFLQKKNMKKKMAAGDTAAKDSKLGKPSNGDGKAAPKGKGGVTHGTPESQKYSTGGKMKSAEGFKKHCSSGDMMKKKSKKMKESSGYERPQDVDHSEAAFERSLKNMFGNPHQTFSDGLKDVSEDLLLHPDLAPGEAGFPQPLHNHNDVPNVTESIEELHKRIAQLEKQLKK
jgi:hypothetical protein